MSEHFSNIIIVILCVLMQCSLVVCAPENLETRTSACHRRQAPCKVCNRSCVWCLIGLLAAERLVYRHDWLRPSRWLELGLPRNADVQTRILFSLPRYHRSSWIQLLLSLLSMYIKIGLFIRSISTPLFATLNVISQTCDISTVWF